MYVWFSFWDAENFGLFACPIVLKLMWIIAVFFLLQRASLGDMKFDNPQTANYTEVLKDCSSLREAFKLLRSSVRTDEITVETQEEVGPSLKN